MGSAARRRTLAIHAALLAAALAAPFLLSSYHIFQLTLAIAYAIALLGLNMLTGYGGQVSLGHGAFYAIGAYAAAILMTRFGIAYWAAVPLAGAACFAAGFLFGLPALRLEGPYLALATFALAVATPQLLKVHWLAGWTGGVEGIAVAKPAAPAFLPIGDDQFLYLFALSVAAALFLAARNLLRGRVGRAIVALRDHPVAAAAMGVDGALYKSLLFAVSALFTGIAGALGGIAVQFVAPDSFTAFLSISLLVGVVIGGLASLSGAIYGALFITFVPNAAGAISTAAPWAIYGVLLIAVMFAMPSGIAGFIGALTRRRRHGKPEARCQPMEEG